MIDNINDVIASKNNSNKILQNIYFISEKLPNNIFFVIGR